jgi:hypothetical protein
VISEQYAILRVKLFIPRTARNGSGIHHIKKKMVQIKVVELTRYVFYVMHLCDGPFFDTRISTV